MCAAADADYPPPPPYTYVGTELVALESRDMDSQLVEEDRWLDGNGHSCSMLDIYRWCAYREGDHGDYSEAARVRADIQRQLDAGAAGAAAGPQRGGLRPGAAAAPQDRDQLRPALDAAHDGHPVVA